MQNKINKIKHTGVYVLVVDDYLYKTGDIFGEWVFLPMDSPAISKYDDTYVIIKYDLSDITNQTQKNWIQKQIEQNKHNISRLNNILIAYMENEVGSIVLAGVSAQTTWEILEKAPWVFTVGGPRIIMIPATRHDALRRWLWEHGFSFAADRPVQAAGRWYAVMAAEYTGRVYAPTFAECLFGSTGEWPEGKGYADWQKAKLPRMRLGVPDGSPLAAEIDAILKEGTEG